MICRSIPVQRGCISSAPVGNDMTPPFAGNRRRQRTQVLTGLKLSYTIEPVRYIYRKPKIELSRLIPLAPLQTGEPRLLPPWPCRG